MKPNKKLQSRSWRRIAGSTALGRGLALAAALFGSMSLASAARASSWSSPSTWTVCPGAGPGSPYSDIQNAINQHRNEATIQAAVNAAMSGDTIEVCPGTYPEQVVINGKQLNVYGPSTGVIRNWSPLQFPPGSFPPGQAIIMPGALLVANASDVDTGQPIAAVVVAENAANINLTNFTIDSSGNTVDACATGALGSPSGNVVGILYQNAAGEAYGNQVQHTNPGVNNNGSCNSGFAIFAQSNSTNAEQVEIISNAVLDYSEQGITVNDFPLTAEIQGNVVTGNGPDPILQNAIQLAFEAVGQVQQNTVVNNVYSACTVGVGNCIYGATDILVASTDSQGGHKGFGPAPGFGPGPGGCGSTSLRVEENVVGVSNVPILLDEVAGGTVEANTVYASQVLDGIQVIGSFTNQQNEVDENNVFNSAEFGINIRGVNNFIGQNVINGAPVGLELSSASGNQVGFGNLFFNTQTPIVDPPAQTSIQPLVRR